MEDRYDMRNRNDKNKILSSVSLYHKNTWTRLGLNSDIYCKGWRIPPRDMKRLSHNIYRIQPVHLTLHHI
jgi:hypothetical protein